MSEPRRLTRAEQEAWLEQLGDIVVFCDRTLLPIYESGVGVTIDAAVNRAVYLVVDPDDFVVYVGKVDRAVGMVADRFRDHHKYTEDWDRVWVVALATTLTNHEVLDVEDQLIAHFDPIGNERRSVSRAVT